MLYCSLKSRGLTAWLWLFKSASRHEAVNMARPGLAYLGLAWPGSRPQAGPCTALGQISERDSQPGWVFTRSCQWFWSDLIKHEKGGLTPWMGVHPFLSGVLICSNMGEGLTSWMGVHTFLSGVQNCSNMGEGLTSWMGVHPFLSGVLICSNMGEGLTIWLGVHPFLSRVLICSNMGEGLTNWMGVHPFLSGVLICSNMGEGLTIGVTSWMGVHPFLSGFWSAQT